MPHSGSGTGTPITPPAPGGAGSGGSTIIVAANDDYIRECSVVKLARYAQIIGYNECQFWGVSHNINDKACRIIWTLQQRKMAAKYLCEAQAEIEHELGYYIGLKWTQELKRFYACPMMTDWGYVQAFGVETYATISAGTAVNHASDPAVIGPIATSVTDTSEIVVFHPGTDVEITPSEITISGGLLTIKIPRCRMVKLAYLDNPTAGLTYNLVATWGETTVDVKRRYNDTTTQAVMSTNHKCSLACASTGCAEYTQTACGYVKKPDIGKVEIYAANYTGGAWVRRKCQYTNYDEVKLNYLSGVALTPQYEDMIVRLAHSKMPQEPCGCDPARSMWTRDRNVPTVLTQERINCAYGLSDGAFWTWMQTMSLRLYKGAGIL